MKEKGGCLQRIYGSIGDNLYAVCSSSTGNIAVGGADRTVTIYDPRRLVIIRLVSTMLTVRKLYIIFGPLSLSLSFWVS